ncbi:hypothetical protein CKY12_14575 [Photorhabdus sp. S12-55]|nr:hypothetical protein PluDJC_18735 [Photorhabdus laumondii subsp. laumondii]RAW75859.1 hypothetical protein CKY15_00380 [Photorhabdus sp. S7-51]RAW77655.1 hypothetical protein CKY06_11540 [Photorhabdus sp. S15-56]RAW83570.1 hypothetical protein CKY12_14575 [Photorhabdus sp. S12-55]RAW83674.1 hypothetical protein CKY09_14305 [Photorhabdus sp. S5P8-50]
MSSIDLSAPLPAFVADAIPRSNATNINFFIFIPVIFQVASLLAALAHPGHIVIYAPGDSLPCHRDPS